MAVVLLGMFPFLLFSAIIDLQQYREPLWKFGTQPVLLLVAYRQWSEMDPLWNVNGKDLLVVVLEGRTTTWCIFCLCVCTRFGLAGQHRRRYDTESQTFALDG